MFSNLCLIDSTTGFSLMKYKRMFNIYIDINKYNYIYMDIYINKYNYIYIKTYNY